MIEMLKDWVKDLVIITIFASLVEMLLPNSSLRKYLKVVIGFFIFLTILNPILTLIDSEMDVFYPFQKISVEGKRQGDSVKNQGQAIKTKNEELAISTFERQLKKQIQALILTQSEVNDTEVAVKVDNNGRIDSLKINLAFQADNESGVIDTVEDVEISIGSKDKEEVESTLQKERNIKVEKKIEKLVSSFYNIKAEAISFQ